MTVVINHIATWNNERSSYLSVFKSSVMVEFDQTRGMIQRTTAASFSKPILCGGSVVSMLPDSVILNAFDLGFFCYYLLMISLP